MHDKDLKYSLDEILNHTMSTKVFPSEITISSPVLEDQEKLFERHPDLTSKIVNDSLGVDMIQNLKKQINGK